MYLKVKIEQKSISQSTERIGFLKIMIRPADSNRLSVSFTGKDFTGSTGGDADKKYHPLFGSPNLNFEAREMVADSAIANHSLIGEYLRSIIYKKGVHGFGLTRDKFGLWLLEVDRIVARESLTVPELVKNRVTVANNQTWFTDNAIVESVEAIEFKEREKIVRIEAEKGGGSTFMLDDLLRGVYLEELNGGLEFQTVLMTVREVIEPHVLRVSLDDNTPPPRAELIVVRTGNRTNTERQNSIFIDGARPAMFYYVNVATHTIGVENIVQATGNLRGYNFGALTGYKEITERFTNIIRGGNYQEGNFMIRSGGGISYPMPADRGAWADIPLVEGVRRCYHYDRVSHAGSIWDCAITETVAEPSNDSNDWTKRVEKGTSPYVLTFQASAGAEFYRDGQSYSAIIRATLHSGVTDVSDTLHRSCWRWRRESQTPVGDEMWNALHEIVGRQIVLTEADLSGDTTFRLTVYAADNTELADRAINLLRG